MPQKLGEIALAIRTNPHFLIGKIEAILESKSPIANSPKQKLARIEAAIAEWETLNKSLLPENG
jgi:hypothetical protein